MWHCVCVCVCVCVYVCMCVQVCGDGTTVASSTTTTAVSTRRAPVKPRDTACCPQRFLRHGQPATDPVRRAVSLCRRPAVDRGPGEVAVDDRDDGAGKIPVTRDSAYHVEHHVGASRSFQADNIGEDSTDRSAWACSD